MTIATPINGFPYMGQDAPNPRNTFYRRRSPTTSDRRLYKVGDRWVNTASQTVFILLGKTATTANWGQISGAAGQFTVDAFTAPGTNPVVPIAGNVTITGGQVAAGSTANAIRTNSLAANTYTVQVQRSSAQAVSTIGANGVSHFDNSMFIVDANGFVQLAGGMVALDSIQVDAFTAPGTNPVLADGAGLMTVTGTQIAASGFPIRTNSLAVNSYQVQLQRSSAQAVSTLTANGICHFDSADFSVDANGFVSSLSGTGPWLDTAGGALAAFTGYFVTAAAVVTLPAAPAQGTIVEIIDVIGGGVVVTAGGADIIQIQNIASSAGGTATSTQFGDALRIVYRTIGTRWLQCPGSGGVWGLA